MTSVRLILSIFLFCSTLLGSAQTSSKFWMMFEQGIAPTDHRYNHSQYITLELYSPVLYSDFSPHQAYRFQSTSITFGTQLFKHLNAGLAFERTTAPTFGYRVHTQDDSKTTMLFNETYYTAKASLAYGFKFYNDKGDFVSSPQLSVNYGVFLPKLQSSYIYQPKEGPEEKLTFNNQFKVYSTYGGSIGNDFRLAKVNKSEVWLNLSIDYQYYKYEIGRPDIVEDNMNSFEIKGLKHSRCWGKPNADGTPNVPKGYFDPRGPIINHVFSGETGIIIRF